MRLAVVILTLLAGCAQSQIVEVPVATTCVPPSAPAAAPAIASNPELAALDDERLVLQIAAERLDLLSYARQAEAVIKACR